MNAYCVEHAKYRKTTHVNFCSLFHITRNLHAKNVNSGLNILHVSSRHGGGYCYPEWITCCANASVSAMPPPQDFAISPINPTLATTKLKYPTLIAE